MLSPLAQHANKSIRKARSRPESLGGWGCPAVTRQPHWMMGKPTDGICSCHGREDSGCHNTLDFTQMHSQGPETFPFPSVTCWKGVGNLRSLNSTKRKWTLGQVRIPGASQGEKKTQKRLRCMGLTVKAGRTDFTNYRWGQPLCGGNTWTELGGRELSQKVWSTKFLGHKEDFPFIC